MDLFFECAPLSNKRRVHFHEFMLEVHHRMYNMRKDRPDVGDTIPLVASDILSTAKVLCFDEFQVTDIADAMIMRRLFRELLAGGLVIVVTSNRQPGQLYQGGMDREAFLPCIEDLEARCEVHDLASGTDYRTLNAVCEAGGTFLHPLTTANAETLDTLFDALTKGNKAVPQTLRVGSSSRTIQVPVAASAVARFEFTHLCGDMNAASSDYLAIAHAFHTVVVGNVPQLTPAHRNQVRRFITFVVSCINCATNIHARNSLLLAKS